MKKDALIEAKIGSLDILKDKQQSINGLEKRLEGLLKAKADPYKELAKSERIRNATYEVPKGLTEEQTMLLTIGAMSEDRILDEMTLGDEKKNERDFFVMYLYENVFASVETQGRIGNVPIMMGEARENAAKAFREYGEGKPEAVQEMGKAFIKRLYESFSTKFVITSDQSMTYGLVVKKALQLMNHPDLGLQNVLNESQKEQMQTMATVCDMRTKVLDAEIKLQENLPDPGTNEREEALKKAWLMHAVSRQLNYEMEAVNDDVSTVTYVTVAKVGEAKKYDQIMVDPNAFVLKDDLLYKMRKQVMLPSQMILSNEEYTKMAMDAYWEEMKKTQMYTELMQADKNTFVDLLQTAREKDLPKITALDKVLQEKTSENQKIRDAIVEEYEVNFTNVLPKIKERLAAVEKRNALLDKLGQEMSNDRLAGSMKTMQEYVSVMKTMSGGWIKQETYDAYLEAMEQVVEKTEALYEKTQDGAYVPLTKEDLKELQDCYKNAYLLAREAREVGNAQRNNFVCEVLERNIVALGLIDKKNLTNLPDAMETAKTSFLEVNGNQLKQAHAAQNTPTQLQYTDVNGETLKGTFTAKSVLRSVTENFGYQVNTIGESYPKFGKIGMQLLKQSVKQPDLISKFTWDNNKIDNFESLSAEEAKEAFLDNLLVSLGDVLQKSHLEIIKNNKQDAIAYFTRLTDEMSVSVQNEKVYNQLGLLGDTEYRLDTRNVAMYSVAELLGAPDIVAKAQQVNLQNEGKNTIQGTFVEVKDGVDISKLPKDHEMRGYDDKVYNNGKGIKSLADLQVLDYICLNIDRHPGNMLYQFDNSEPGNPKFVGVQGINNEASFGIMVKDEDFAPTNNVTKLEDLGVISESVFKSIMDMDIVTFRLSMKTQDFKEPEVEAACVRLQKLRDKVIADAEFFKDKEPGELEPGKIRIVSDEAFEKLTIDNILKAAPNAKLFQNMKTQVMGGVSFANNPALKEKEQKQQMMNKIVHGDANKTIRLEGSQADIGSKNYYAKLQSDLSKYLLEINRADSLLRGSSKEYKEVKKSIRESIELIGKMENPNPEYVDRVKESLHKVTQATEAYQAHKKVKSSGSEYEKVRVSLIDALKNSVERKENTLNAEIVKYHSRVEDAEKRQERIQERKAENRHQMKEFVSNILNWNAKQPKEDLRKVLGSAIVTGSMTQYALTAIDQGKQDKLFNMTKEQFDKQITNLLEDVKFQAYYQSLNEEDLQKNLASQKPIDSYYTDFQKYTATSKIEQQQKQEKEQVKENIGVGGINL